MTSEYEKLLSLVSKINKCQGEKCLICHFPDKDENLIKLKCHHYFHFHCISSNNKLEENIKCPYCDKISKIIKNIEHCKYTLQKGPNKGNEFHPLDYLMLPFTGRFSKYFHLRGFTSFNFS